MSLACYIEYLKRSKTSTRIIPVKYISPKSKEAPVLDKEDFRIDLNKGKDDDLDIPLYGPIRKPGHC